MPSNLVNVLLLNVFYIVPLSLNTYHDMPIVLIIF